MAALAHQLGDGIPMDGAAYRATHGSGSLVGGTRNTCQPDAVTIVLYDMGMELPRPP